jgi:peptidylprolyl isomerase/peptidyl-prolyl cis-trans isomerase A (cyclophilin A)
MPRMSRPALLAALALAPALALAASTPAPPAKAPPAKEPPAAREPAAKGGEQYVTFETSAGRIGARLLPDEAPNGVANFVALATGKKEWTDPSGQKTRRPLYDGTVFHRVIPAFMIQGGDPRGNGTGDPGYRFADELQAGTRPFDKPCQLAYANSGPNTNGSQFFITEVATPHLNPRPCSESPSGVCGYVRFGVGVCGCDLVAKIAREGNSKVTLKRVVVSSTPPTCK